jgi:hypothetical protein
VSKVVLFDRCNTFVSFSEDELHFRGRRSTLESSIVISSSGGNVQIPWQALHFVTYDEN